MFLERFKTRKTKESKPYKLFEIKKSTIKNSGLGLFLTCGAKPGEKIARYSGVPIDPSDVTSCGSQYLFQVSKNVILCAAGDDEWEGKYAQDGPRGGKAVNARFTAATVVNQCRKTGKLYANIIATKIIPPTGGEIFVDYKWTQAQWELILSCAVDADDGGDEGTGVCVCVCGRDLKTHVCIC